MNRDVDNIRIQKKISIFISKIGILVALFNFIQLYFFYEKGFVESITSLTVSSIFLFTIVIYASSYLNHKIIGYFQLVVLLLVACLSFLDNDEAFFGFGFVITALILAYKYGFLEKHPKIKLSIGIAALIVVLEISIRLNNPSFIGGSIANLLYLSFFCWIIYIAYSSEIKRILKIEKIFKRTIKDFESEREEMESLIKKRESDLKNMQLQYMHLEQIIEKLSVKDTKINPGQVKLSEYEEAVLKCLCRHPEFTNKEVGFKLDINENAVKQYNRRLFRKLKVKSRTEMVKRCSWYYS